MTEVCCAGFVRFVTLRTGWLRSPFMRLVLPPRSAWGKQSRCHRQSPTKAANEAGCEQARFLSGVPMGKEWACVPKFGRSLAASGTQKGHPPALIMSPAKMGRYRCDQKGTRKLGLLPPRSAESTTQQSGERRSNDSVWKLKCAEEVGEERLSAQRRIEPQCESHSSQ
jgi:hypothetical protein